MPKFTLLEYRNVQSVGNHPIKIQLDRNPTTVIGGQNGTGKSTMGFALTYGLYGRFPNGAKLADAINSVNKKNLLVKVWFEERGDEYLVVRGEKPKKFEIYKNDEMLDQSANARDQQKILDSILGMDFSMFTQLVMLNKEQYEPFMQLPLAGRRKIVETILGIGIFGYMNDVVKEKIKSNQAEMATVETNYQVEQSKYDSQLKLIEQIEQSMQEQSQSILDEIESDKKAMEKLSEEIAEHGEKLEALDDPTEQINSINKQIVELRTFAISFKNKIQTAEKHKTFFESNDICPTCSQSITDDLKQSKVHECQSEIDQTVDAQTQLDAKLEELTTSLSELQNLENRRSEIKSEIKLLIREYDLYKKSVKSKQDKLDAPKNDSKLTEAQDQLDTINQKIESLREQSDELKQQAQLLERMRVTLKDDGVKSVIVKEYINLINKKVNEYLQSMGFYINIVLDENFKESFKALHKENFTMSNLSTGQKTRVNLAIWLALLEVGSIKNSVVSNILFIDEILEAMDATGVEDFMKLCREMLSDKNIFVVTQRFDEFKDYFRSSIKFKLNEGFTEMGSE